MSQPHRRFCSTSLTKTLVATKNIVMTRAAKLTPTQRAQVRSLMVDSGWTRSQAVAWVLAFGAVS